MNKKPKYLAFCLLAFFVFPVISLAQQKRILVIFSYDSTYHIYKESEGAIGELFPSDQYLVDVEFLDSKRYSNNQLNQTIVERIKIKESDSSKYKVVIACNDNALDFCLKNQYSLFNHVPIIFWGINDLKKAFEQDQNEWVTGIATNASFEKTLQLIRTIHPNKRKLDVIRDNTPTGTADFKTFTNAIKRYPELEYQIINSSQYDLEEFQKRLEKIPADDIIFHISSSRLKGSYSSLEQSKNLLSKKGANIIYGSFNHLKGYGILGGKKSMYYEQMHDACLIAKQVLNGASMKNLKVFFGRPAPNILDYNALVTHHVDLKLVPDDVTIINKPEDHFEISKSEFITTSVAIVIVFILLFLLILLINSWRKAEKNQRLFAENYLNIFKENHSMMLLIDTETKKIIDSNKAAARFYGYNQNELVNLPFYRLCQLPEIDIDAFFMQSQRRNSHFEQKHQTKSGQIKDVEIHSGKVSLRNKTFIYTIIHDISQRIEAEHELILAKKKAEESDRLKSAFLANMSHEIRTPMNSIIGFSSLLEDENLPIEMRRQFINHIQSSGDHLLMLINDIIDLSKIEANQLKVSYNECNLNPFLDEIYSLFTTQIERSFKKDLKLVLHKGVNREDFIIKTDELRLKQILLNLLSNALKFTDTGIIEFGYKYREDSVIQFYVKDTGIGIPKERQQEIFSAFQQIEEYSSRNHGGTGLGLSITRSLVEKLGGHIWVMSEQGEGARFYFTHPSSNSKLALEDH